MVLHNKTILICGDWHWHDGKSNTTKECLQLNNGSWIKHSTFNDQRFFHSTVTTQTATFVFGGGYSPRTYEYLPNASTKWRKAHFNDIPRGFSAGCAIAVKSDQEIWLIGGTMNNEQRILKFNVKDHTFQVSNSKLNVRRYHQKCAFIPHTNKIMLTGGIWRGSALDSAEIIDTDDESVTMASPMKRKRYEHGMGVITINGEDRIAVVGGFDERTNTRLDSVELYNTQKMVWEMADFKLKQGKQSFGFMTVKLSDIICQLKQKSELDWPELD